MIDDLDQYLEDIKSYTLFSKCVITNHKTIESCIEDIEFPIQVSEIEDILNKVKVSILDLYYSNKTPSTWYSSIPKCTHTRCFEPTYSSDSVFDSKQEAISYVVDLFSKKITKMSVYTSISERSLEDYLTAIEVKEVCNV